MLSSQLFTTVTKQMRSGVCTTRNIGVFAPALQKATDPIQKLFLDKIAEYKSKSTGGKLVDPTPDIERELKSELEKVAKHYGGAEGEDMTQFPKFTFPEAHVDPVTQQS